MPAPLLSILAREYAEHGFDTLPLSPGTKKALHYGWGQRSPDLLWQDAPADANLGIRGGGTARAAIIDCDEKYRPGTFGNAVAWLAGLGLRDGSYPVVQTASGLGRHIYVSLKERLDGNTRKLSPETGAGEFRYGPGAYVVAPCSTLSDGGTYSLVAGQFSCLPSLALSDILPLLGNKDVSARSSSKTRISRHAWDLLQGRVTDPDRSKAETRLINSLVNSEQSYPQILALFRYFPCSGHFSDLQRARGVQAAEGWLYRTYLNALKWTETHQSEGRRVAESAINWAKSRPWPGRTGASDRAAFLAVAHIAYGCGRIEFHASCREVAERAGIGRDTASDSLRRLVDLHHLLIVTKESSGDLARVYRISAEICQTMTLPTPHHVGECHSLVDHDAFRKGRGRSGLGKTAQLVYTSLQESPMTLSGLTEKTARGRRAVVRALTRMSEIIDPHTGEVIEMVSELEGGVWQAHEVDLNQVARLVGTAGTAQRQRKMHEVERQQHRRAGRKAAQIPDL